MENFKRKPLALVLIAAIALSAGAVAIFSSKSGAAPASGAGAAKPALTVTTALPQPLSLPVKLSANGSITAWQEAIIGSESNGLRLIEVRVNVGDKVKAGQVLAVFYEGSVQADTAQARASLLEAQANALDAADNAARARTLERSGALSAQQINQYNTAEQTAKARVEAAQAVLAAQQLRGRQTRVLAPDSGVISARSATLGAVVGAGTELFRMIRGGRLEWRAEVTSAELGRIQPGTPVTVTAASGAELRGRVRMVAPSVDPQTRAGLVYVDLPGSAGMASPAKAGMFARGEFELGTTAALTVPQPALVLRDGFSYVFRLNADQRISQLKVQTGRRVGDRVEITAGLAADTRVIVSGAGFLNDGDLVRVNDASTSNQPAAPASSAQIATN
ncbi:efflux RND transporter periplasmic adaptor subunit [Polaromonas jejuensis]|uniref:Efflux RND transporter periplasmic adaptor subunit n=1 Tax=Polaromonas jejuensis TaxID=457502 RepID=A0ABW0QAT0_9BURK|nr:efflux RND transporter periplasmic adaptor subunit [Polaromonas jejuensis]